MNCFQDSALSIVSFRPTVNDSKGISTSYSEKSKGQEYSQTWCYMEEADRQACSIHVES